MAHDFQYSPIRHPQIFWRPARMGPSGWTRSVRAVRDTPVADYSAPGLITTRHIAYHSPIAVSPDLLTLSVSYCTRTLWRWGQLWPYFWMQWLGTRMHLDCNVMGDVTKITPRVASTCAQHAIFSLPIIYLIPSHQIDIAIDNPSVVPSVSSLTTSSYLWNYVDVADDVSHTENLKCDGC